MRTVANRVGMSARMVWAFIPYPIKFGIVWGTLGTLCLAFWVISFVGVL